MGGPLYPNNTIGVGFSGNVLPFARYNALANAGLRTLNIDMPDFDLSSLREVPWTPRRTVTPPAPPL
jgi:hypothetical protein